MIQKTPQKKKYYFEISEILLYKISLYHIIEIKTNEFIK